MRRITVILCAVLLGSGCGGGCGGDDAPLADAGVADAAPDAQPPGYLGCADSDQAFVRNAYLAVLGQRPMGQAEVDVYVDIMTEVRALNDDASDPYEVVVRAMSTDPAYVDRWSEHLMDAVRVPRIEDQSMESCYGRTERELDDGSLAAHVRDHAGSANDDGQGSFTMRDLVRSSLVLDDVSPVYRGHLYALVSRAIPAANVPRVERELARREDFGLVFDSAYLNRDIVCLGCHNSEGSVTYDPDPELNRHWSLPGLFEKALYGESTGIAVERAHAPFRYDGFVADVFDDNGFSRPWGWTPSCGGFFPDSLPPDPAGVDGKFGDLTGDQLTVYDLEAALRRGIDTITTSGLQIGDDGTIGDPDAAFAYMVAASIVESVWKEVIGSPLTIANYFARNEAQRDLLHELTDTFVASRFSLTTLVVAITKSPYFNRQPPENGCGEPYDMPAVYDPWVIADDDPALRANGPGDSVTALSGRTLLHTVYKALEWPAPRFQRFPETPTEVYVCQQFGLSCSQMLSTCQNQGYCCVAHDLLCENPPGPGEPTARDEQTFQRGVGAFLKNGERGFRGLDFQARLVWEDRFGTCSKPTSEDDFVDEILALAASRGGTVGDVAAALKDRLVGEPDIAGAEQSAIEALFGAGLADPASGVTDLEDRARRFCGVLVSSPQFLLGGIAARGGDVPVLTPDDASYDAVCAAIAARGLADLSLTCGDGSVTVTP
jgi:hypothetical protein